MSGFTRLTLSLSIGAFISPVVVEGQTGLTSGVAQVALQASVPPSGSVQIVGPVRESTRMGLIREVSTSLLIAVNTGYRLTLRRAGGTTSRIWVRNVTGEFQTLTADSPVTVARDPGARGDSESEVLWRIESTGAELGEFREGYPVWYELAIDPTM